MRASQPSSRFAFSTDGQRRWTSTSKLGRCFNSNSAGSRPDASQMISAMSAMVRSSDAEMLKSSFSPARALHRRDDAVRDVVHVGERARLLARPEDLKRVLARERLADQVGYGVRDPRLVIRQLAGPVRVEGPADRVRKPVLVVQRAAVDLASELREAIGGPWSGAAVNVALRGRELGRVLEHHRGRYVDETLDRLLQGRPKHGVVEGVVHLEQRVRKPVEVGDAADDRREVDHVRAVRHRGTRRVELAQVAAGAARTSRPSKREPRAGPTRARSSRPRAAAA